MNFFTFINYYFFRGLHSPLLIEISSSNLRDILEFINKSRNFCRISDSLSHVSSLICEVRHKTLMMGTFLLWSSFSPQLSIFIGLTSSVKSSFTSTGTWGNTLEGSTSACRSKETWNTLWTLANYEGKFISYATGLIRFWISNDPMNLGANFPFMSNLSMCFHGITFRNTLSLGKNSSGILWIFAYFFCLS